jgi:hypothetical protein
MGETAPPPACTARMDSLRLNFSMSFDDVALGPRFYAVLDQLLIAVRGDDEHRHLGM